MGKKEINYEVLSDDDLKSEFGIIFEEIMNRLEVDAIRDGHIDELKESAYNRSKKVHEYKPINRHSESEWFNNENKIEMYKAIRTVTGLSLVDTRRFTNLLGYTLRSFRHFRD